MKEIWNESCILSPSLICLDMCNLEREVKTLEKAGIKMLHVDILDGHFSPSMPLGLDTVRQLRAKTDMFFDCHVMVTEQDYFVDELLDIGVDQIVFHGETQPHIDGMLNRIHAKGVKAGVALKPATPLSELEYVLDNGIRAHCVGEINEPAIKKDDLLIVGSGSGGSLFPLGIARKARASVDCTIVHIGSNPNSEMKDIEDFMVRIPVRTKNYLEDEIDSCQPMTSLFEQSVLLLGDVLAKMIIEQRHLDMRSLWQYHANLE